MAVWRRLVARLVAAGDGVATRLGRPGRARVCGVLVLALPFVLSPFASRRICREVGHEVAQWLAWVAWLSEPSRNQSDDAAEPEGDATDRRDDQDGQDSQDEDPKSPADDSSRAPRPTRERRRPGLPLPAPTETRQPARMLGLEVSAEVVRSAVPPRARPSGAVVEPNALRPGGIEVRNPGILGAYIQPGDVVTEAEGQRVVDFGTLVGVVTRAYAHHAEAVHGKLWRRGRSLSVTVHLPYEQATDPRGRGTK